VRHQRRLRPPQLHRTGTSDWSRLHGTVRRLQARIVKATQAGDWRRVKACNGSDPLVAGKAVAVKRVTENQGKNTPG